MIKPVFFPPMWGWLRAIEVLFWRLAVSTMEWVIRHRRALQRALPYLLLALWAAASYTLGWAFAQALLRWLL